ncbi:Transmembrane domain-containing protein [Spironucleus salmonicida]|uniref:Transmembrane domain-containing protein n=1 Tax=Spironucleus salmonicida TaxID=348837 RepID=V6LY05_9EUKA|nr:Transmembrane domain-containing protein [Spironucleus salmonicida]|eukprot:EST48601.1 Transmembrane domain-containing protein [Spironucleus salmonicida]
MIAKLYKQQYSKFYQTVDSNQFNEMKNSQQSMLQDYVVLCQIFPQAFNGNMLAIAAVSAFQLCIVLLSQCVSENLLTNIVSIIALFVIFNHVYSFILKPFLEKQLPQDHRDYDFSASLELSSLITLKLRQFFSSQNQVQIAKQVAILFVMYIVSRCLSLQFVLIIVSLILQGMIWGNKYLKNEEDLNKIKEKVNTFMSSTKLKAQQVRKNPETINSAPKLNIDQVKEDFTNSVKEQ